MDDFPSLGRILIFAGVALCVVGLALVFGPRIPFLGRLPGDIVAGDDHFRVYLPIATSIVLTVLLNLLRRLFK